MSLQAKRLENSYFCSADIMGTSVILRDNNSKGISSSQGLLVMIRRMGIIIGLILIKVETLTCQCLWSMGLMRMEKLIRENKGNIGRVEKE
jgi:hypothetical protein